jgi:signal transduction histidine kinase/ActR/RegA family two-component response regulator
MRTAALRQRLMLLIAVAIVPLALMSGVGLAALLHQQEQQTERAALNLTRALATAVDNELRSTVSALQALALSPVMSESSAEAHALAQLAQAARPEWLAVLLLTASGEVIFSTGAPYGERQQLAVEMASVREVVRTRAPAVGSVRPGRFGNFGVPVRVPVLRDGAVLYVLTAVMRPEAILQVVQRQRIPEDWVVSVFDGSSLRVARSREHERFIAQPPTPSLQRMIAALRDDGEMFGPSETLEGTPVHTAVARIASVRWIVALGVPREDTVQAVRSSALAYGGGLVLSLVLGFGAAWLVSRGIAQPMARLRQIAGAMGSARLVQASRSGVTEIDAVSDALVSAAAARQLAESEREQLLDKERAARAAAEHAQRRLQILANASSALSSTLEEEGTLRAIGAIIVPEIADVCRIDLLDADGVLQRKLTHHADPERAKAIEQFVRSASVAPDTPGSFPWVIATGQSYLANFQSPEQAGITDPTFHEFAVRTGMRATCVVPLVARGRTIGVMGALQAESGRQYTPEEGELVAEIARRAAFALDNVRLYAEAQCALQQAQVAARAKDEFLAVLGHELRNPLAPIVTSLDLMARRDGPVDVREREVIERHVKHLARMVDDLLDVSRITSGKVQLHRQVIDLRDVVARAVELTQPALAERAIVPQLHVPAEPVCVDGDAVRLTQVLCNLLNNAAKFSDAHGSVGIELRRSGPQAQVTVWDRGSGIVPALLPHVFEPFVQGESAVQRTAGGLGLGLAIARNLVELHGGHIRAESDGAGAGSRFSVTLAAVDAPAVPIAEPPRLAPGAAVRPTRGARIAIVDDNVDAAESLAELLRFDGHQVSTAYNGHDALQLMQAQLPQVALLDIGLPDMDGYELAARLRADPRTQPIQLVALTGFGREPDRRRALAAGFQDHLTKPVDIGALLECLAPLVDGASLPAA